MMFKSFILLLLLSLSTLSALENFELKSSYYVTDQNLSLEEIKTIKDFTLSKGKNFGLNNKIIWIKLEIKNNTKREVHKIVQFKFSSMDYITVYNGVDKVEKYGLLNKYNKKINAIGNNAFRIHLDAFKHKIIYIQIISSYNIKTFLEVFDEYEYENKISFHKMLFHFAYGILFGLIVFNFIIWHLLRQEVFFYYTIFHFIFLLGILSWTWFGFEYLWANYPIINYYTYGVLGNLLYAFQILFIVSYLDAKKFLPKTTQVLKIFFYVFLLFSFTSVIFQVTLLYELFSIASSFLLIGMIFYMAVVKKMTIAYYILVSELIIIFGNGFMVLSDIGITNSSFYMDYFYVWGASTEAIIMSFALAYKYKELQDQKNIEMKKRKEIEELLSDKQRLSMMGEMLNNLVHQWKQPLSQINAIVYHIESDYQDNKLDYDNLDAKLNSIEATTHYLSQTIDDFKNFSIMKNNIESFYVKNLIDNVLSVMQFTLKMHEITIKTTYSHPNIQLLSNQNELSQVLMIISNNAQDALLESQTKNPKILINVLQNGKKIIISISNNAKQIEDDVIDNIFDAYYTTKSSHGGVGLGLYLAKYILDKLDASLSVVSTEGKTTFSISF